MARTRITVDGRLALTTAQAAHRYGRTLTTMRKILSRLDVDPVDHLDDRTPLYAARDLDTAIAAMPGRGARTDLNRSADTDQGTPMSPSTP